MLIGHTVGITRMILDFVYPSPRCGEEDVRPGVVAGIHFTYFSVLLLGLSWVVCLVGSLLTEAPSRSAVSVGAPAPFRDCITQSILLPIQGLDWICLFYSYEDSPFGQLTK